MIDFNTLLVPVDFSPASRAAYAHALELVTGEKPFIVLLHVLDPALADFADAHGLGSTKDVLQSMRKRAEGKLEDFKQEAKDNVDVESIISEGVPFLEILKKADEFQVHAIVMGKLGTRGKIEELLFGSTAERVIRGSATPVIVLPFERTK